MKHSPIERACQVATEVMVMIQAEVAVGPGLVLGICAARDADVADAASVIAAYRTLGVLSSDEGMIGPGPLFGPAWESTKQYAAGVGVDLDERVEKARMAAVIARCSGRPPSRN